MRHRVRPFDLLTVVGVLVLLVWAPTYMAQEPSEREVGSGITFRVPEPMIGDQIETTLLATFANGTALGMDHERWVHLRTPEPDELWGAPIAARDAALVVEQRSGAGHWDLGFCEQARDFSMTAHYYDEDGRTVWSKSEGHQQPSEDIAPGWPPEEAVERTWGVTGRYIPLDPLQYVGDRVRYVPSTILDPINRHFDKSPTEDGEMRATGMSLDEDTLTMSQRARSHHGIAVYSYRTTSHTYELASFRDHFENGTRHGAIHQECTWRLMEDEYERGGQTLAIRSWTWLSRDSPVAVGSHTEYVDDAGHVLMALDEVPVRIIRGSERPPVSVDADWGPSGRALPVDQPILPTIDVIELANLDIPLHMGLSLDRLDRAVRIEGLVRDEAILTSFIWNSSTEVTHWYLGFIDRDEATAYRVTVAYTDGRPQIQEITSFCEDPATIGPQEYTFRCGPVGPDARAAGPVVRPDSLLAAIREHHGPATTGSASFPEHFAFLAGKNRNEHWNHFDAAPIGAPVPGAHLSSAARTPTPQYGLAYWNHGDPYWVEDTSDTEWAAGVHFLEDGRAVVYSSGQRTGDLSGIGASAPPRTAVLSAPLAPLSPVPPEIGIGGAILALLGLLARMAAWAHTGGHLPLLAALYAKIRGPKVLDHEHRASLMEALNADPGLTVGAAAEQIRLSRNATLHHLETLRREGLLTTLTLAHERRYFVTGSHAATERVALAARHRPEWRAFLDTVEATPGAALSDLQKTLERRKSGISRTGKQLAELGLVEKRRDGREIRYYPVTPSSSPSPGPAPSVRAETAASRVP